ncbi:MAG: type I restriction enzyme HsdR N-terminal domain-containing protein [Chlorobi bacterium]|nr:type I restriction enzyme HsdR N-terminal domain-containing protein [Chlorobiota bacterium]
MFPKLNLPQYNLKYKETEKGIYVFDIIRKKYILMTPEEHVRQQFIHFLIEEKKYPKGLLAIEKQLKIYKLTKRTDIVLYNKNGNVNLIVECKAPKISISQETFDQIARYNMNFKAKFLIVTNGLNHYCCKADYENNSYTFLKEIPNYTDILK